MFGRTRQLTLFWACLAMIGCCHHHCFTCRPFAYGPVCCGSSFSSPISAYPPVDPVIPMMAPAAGFVPVPQSAAPAPAAPAQPIPMLSSAGLPVRR